MRGAEFGHLTGQNRRLFTDLYELTMLQGYHAAEHNPEATFDLFVRDLPPGRGYLVAAGLEQAIAYLEDLSFSDRELAHLREQGFEEDFLERLADLEFTGDVRAVPEGEVVFPDEPLIEVTAPLFQAQLIETMLINQAAYQTMIATKAARIRDVLDRHGGERSLVDFGSRRAHGTDAGIKAARSAYIGGFDGTSNVAAGELFDIQTYGTMAHSWVQSFDTEEEAFRAYMDEYGEDSILLIDTYDTIEGAELAERLAEEMGIDIRGVRIDSGDLAALSREVTDRTGLDVFVSSGLDEYKIEGFLGDGGVATGFGVGTSLVTSVDAPKLEMVYKLVAVDEDGSMRPEMKLSEGKTTLPGRKQVWRRERDGTYQEDVIGLREEDIDGRPLLEDIYVDGDVVYDVPALEEARSRRETTVSALQAGVRRLEDPDRFAVTVSEGLERTSERLEERLNR